MFYYKTKIIYLECKITKLLLLCIICIFSEHLSKIPIGEPLLNTEFEIRSHDGEIADVGELYIGIYFYFFNIVFLNLRRIKLFNYTFHTPPPSLQ